MFCQDMSQILQKALEARINQAGLDWVKLQTIEISSESKTIRADVVLDGEPEAVNLRVHYLLDDEGIAITDVETSKKWITEMLHYALIKKGNRFPMPGGIKGMVARMIL